MRRPSRRPAWRWLLLLGLVLLVASPALAAHCPSPDPQGDCPKAVDSWWIKFFMPILGAFLGALSAAGNWFSGPWLSTPAYGDEAPPQDKPKKVRPSFVTDPPYNHDVETTGQFSAPPQDFYDEGGGWEKTIEKWRLKGKLKIVDQPSDEYNCHGFTFCARKACITLQAELEKILKENAYQDVTKKRKAIGDVAVYRGPWTERDAEDHDKTFEDGIVHTGVVSEVDEKTEEPTKVTSKWGAHYLYEHAPGTSRPSTRSSGSSTATRRAPAATR